MLLVQPVINVVTAFAQNFLLLPQTSLQTHAPLVNFTVNDTLLHAVYRRLIDAASVH